MELLHEGSTWLNGTEKIVYSQFGEDGIIEAVFNHFGVANRWCLEVGAGDGVGLSNTKALRDQGWEAVLVEGNPTSYANLVSLKSESVRCVHERIGPDSLDRILREHGAPTDIDFVSIDIDGQDYWIWKGLKDFRPRVVCIEFSPYGGKDGPIPECGIDKPFQAGFNEMMGLATEMGYLVLCNTYCNLICVRVEMMD